jgi:hypothetical protein
MDLRAALDRIERMTLSMQDHNLQPAGTKRKLPEPRGPSFGPLRTTRLEREERTERFQAFISHHEILRKLDDGDADAFSDLDGGDEHKMEQE